MRNLSLESTSSISIPCSSGAQITAVAHDLGAGRRYVAVEGVVGGDEVQLEVWRVGEDGKADDAPCAMLMAPAAQGAKTQLVAFNVLAEQQVLCVVLAGGTIATAPLEGELVEFEVVGEVEGGIHAAAWSPEEDVLVLVTGNADLLQMTPTFDVLSESPLHPSHAGAAQAVNVGWGSKATQFHGSLGKQAAQVGSAQVAGLSPDDDRQPRVAWRGDGAFFAVSSVEPASERGMGTGNARRAIRVYSRTGELQTTSEPVPGLEHPLAWKPSGALLASTQRFGFPGGGAGREGRHDVVFLERNGLRHGEFGLREEGKKGEYRVREMAWSAGSDVLAVWIERELGDVVQLWTVNNYHWYLKHSVLPPTPAERFTSLLWHPESSLHLTLTTSHRILDRSFAFSTARSVSPSSSSQTVNDSGTVAVIDGSSLLVTPFGQMNVPPPMCGYKLELGEKWADPPVDVAFDDDGERERMTVLFPRRVDVWELGSVLRVGTGKGKGAVSEPSKACELDFGEGVDVRQVVLDSLGGYVAVLGYAWEVGRDVVIRLALDDGKELGRTQLESTGSGRLVSPVQGVPLMLQRSNGELVPVESGNAVALRLPSFCFHTALLPTPAFAVVGLSAKGALYASSPTTTLTLSTNCTSFVLSPSFLIYTTSAHAAHFVPVPQLTTLLEEIDPQSPLPEWEHRRVERGSRIVTVVPSNMALVLQMPRGNLETINPRPLVLQNVRKDVDGANYRGAFIACRKHRVDLNVLVDHDVDRFMAAIPQFVEQVDEVDYINLFLAGIGQSSQSAARIASICDAIRLQLEARDLQRYISSILTAHVVKSPPDIENGLRLLLRLRDENPEIVEEAIKYIVFLVDVDRLFDIALGMYDFSLVLMIAQHSQKDPREYLPFLRELAALEENYQRFRIDDHLKRYSKAIIHLRQAGDEHWERAKAYLKSHDLWSDALRLWKDDGAKQAEILDMYGDHLMDNKEYGDAALAFVMAHKTEKALLAYERDTAWRELFALATEAGASKERLSDIGSRVSDKLVAKRRYAEGAQVLLDYSNNVEEAVGVLLMGNEYAEAIRIAHLHGQSDLIESHIHPSALNAGTNVLEDIEEMSEQLDKQGVRWDELQAKKLAEPDAFYLQDNPELHNVDVQSTASTAATAFTRYTAAPSALSGATGVSTSKSAKGRRKTERKRLSGKRGSVDEEAYLVSSLGKLVGRLNALQADVARLVPHLLLFSAEHQERAEEVRDALVAFEEKIGAVVERVWGQLEDEAREREKEREGTRLGGIQSARREGDAEKEKEKEKEKRPEKPVVRAVRWRRDLML